MLLNAGRILHRHCAKTPIKGSERTVRVGAIQAGCCERRLDLEANLRLVSFMYKSTIIVHGALSIFKISMAVSLYA